MFQANASLNKKIKAMILCVALFTALLTGCGKEEKVYTEDDFTVSDGKTAAGIAEGSEFADFEEAYEDLNVQILQDGEYVTYVFPNIKKEPEKANEDMTLMVSAFFVDGAYTTTESLLSETGKSAEELADYMGSAEYVNSHDEVRFRFMIFEFEDGKVTSLSSDYLDYDDELFKAEEEK